MENCTVRRHSGRLRSAQFTVRLLLVLTVGVSVIGGVSQLYGEQQLSMFLLLGTWLLLGTAYAVFRCYPALIAHFGAMGILLLIWAVMSLTEPIDSRWTLMEMVWAGAVEGIAIGAVVGLYASSGKRFS